MPRACRCRTTQDHCNDSMDKNPNLVAGLTSGHIRCGFKGWRIASTCET